MSSIGTGRVIPSKAVIALVLLMFACAGCRTCGSDDARSVDKALLEFSYWTTDGSDLQGQVKVSDTGAVRVEGLSGCSTCTRLSQDGLSQLLRILRSPEFREALQGITPVSGSSSGFRGYLKYSDVFSRQEYFLTPEYYPQDVAPFLFQIHQILIDELDRCYDIPLSPN